jgi:hypothetical protein
MKAGNVIYPYLSEKPDAGLISIKWIGIRYVMLLLINCHMDIMAGAFF